MRSEYTGQEAELVPGTLRGYRQWGLVYNPAEGVILNALNFACSWQPGVNLATCQKMELVVFAGRHHLSAPDKDCTCGFYARHGPELLNRDAISGSIKAWGKVILGTGGFRAQYAEIEALVTRPGYAMSRSWDKVLARYNVPVFSNISDLLEEFPPIPVDHLLDERVPPPREEAEQLYKSGHLSISDWNKWVEEWKKQ